MPELVLVSVVIINDLFSNFIVLNALELFLQFITGKLHLVIRPIVNFKMLDTVLNQLQGVFSALFSVAHRSEVLSAYLFDFL